MHDILELMLLLATIGMYLLVVIPIVLLLWESLFGPDEKSEEDSVYQCRGT